MKLLGEGVNCVIKAQSPEPQGRGPLQMPGPPISMCAPPLPPGQTSPQGHALHSPALGPVLAGSSPRNVLPCPTLSGAAWPSGFSSGAAHQDPLR